MNEGIAELVTGHVFALGSVRAVGPLVSLRPDYAFNIVGVGFVVAITIKWSDFDTSDEDENYDTDWPAFCAAATAAHQDAIDKLLKGN